MYDNACMHDLTKGGNCYKSFKIILYQDLYIWDILFKRYIIIRPIYFYDVIYIL